MNGSRMLAVLGWLALFLFSVASTAAAASAPTWQSEWEKALEAAKKEGQVAVYTKAGYDGVFAPDHLFPPGAPGGPALEPFAVLAAVAALHPDLHVGTLVTRASLRPAGLLAKQAAALDQMSGGQAILGLGAGDRKSVV